MTLVHTNRHGLELSKRLLQTASADQGSEETEATGKLENEAKTSFERKMSPAHLDKVSPDLAYTDQERRILTPAAIARHVHILPLDLTDSCISPSAPPPAPVGLISLRRPC